MVPAGVATGAGAFRVIVYATPTLLLVDHAGMVKSEWVGEQGKVDQQKILAALIPACAPAVSPK